MFIKIKRPLKKKLRELQSQRSVTPLIEQQQQQSFVKTESDYKLSNYEEEK